MLPPTTPRESVAGEVGKVQTVVRIAKSISGLIGVLLLLMGGIWILQGLNLAWGVLARSFMQNDRHWAVYGAMLAAVGLGLMVWGFDKPRKR
jgi:hypothetical protein